LIRYELANQTDLDQVLRLNVREYWEEIDQWKQDDEVNRWNISSWWGDIKLLRWHYSVLEKCDGGIFIARDKHHVVGELDFVRSYPSSPKESPRVHIIWILSDPDHRRKGIAKNLIRALQTQVDIPIWVEPEDERTISLYDQTGSVVKYLTNWRIDNIKYIDNLESHPVSINQLFNPVRKDNWILIGNYYSPCFDFNQLANSEEVYQYIWGNTPSHEYYSYEHDHTSATALLTQYPRIAFSSLDYMDEVKDLIWQMSSDILQMGFPSVHLQFYTNNALETILQELEFECEIERDPVYQLFSSF